MLNFTIKASSLIRCAIAVASMAGISSVLAAPKVVELVQTHCQFLESENNVDYEFNAKSASDCEAINERTGTTRLQKAKTIELDPGLTVFRVTNRDVPYDLGFWIRAESLVDRVSLPSTSGGGLAQGTTKDYRIDLKPGSYVYSCPLNPTLDYRIIVREPRV